MRDGLQLALNLTDEEIYYIGMVTAHWGTLQHELFAQTAITFDDEQKERPRLPTELTGLQFTDTLRLWKERVVDLCSSDETKRSLEASYEEILTVKPARDALAHGMWEWFPRDLDRISTTRVKKRELITSHFTTASLRDLAFRLAELNFNVRYPRGLDDLAAERAESNGVVSRQAMKMLAQITGLKKDSENTAGD